LSFSLSGPVVLQNQDVAKQSKLSVEDHRGNRLQLTLAANYLSELHKIEMAFLISYPNHQNDWQEVEDARQDLDRFRRGMYRRETRILELKKEVNQLLKASGEPPRYRSDLAEDDSSFAAKAKTGKSRESEGRP